VTATLEWQLTNQSLKTFDMDDTLIEDDGSHIHALCHALSRVFRNNTTLVNIHLPRMRLCADNAALLVSGLAPNKTIWLLGLSSCTLDNGAWICLEQSLCAPLDSPNKVHIPSVQLAAFAGGERIVKPLLRSLPFMQCTRHVSIPKIYSLDEEENNLLLHAVKEKKTLLSFTTSRILAELSKSPVEKEIAFYFKLNRLGRQILAYTNVRSSIWPILLGGMARDPQNADALFFFLREFFSNYRGGGNQRAP
jgi:hypothetical protein